PRGAGVGTGAPPSPPGVAAARLQVLSQSAREGVERASTVLQLLLEALPVELEVSADDLGGVGGQDGADLRPRHPVAAEGTYDSDPPRGRGHRELRHFGSSIRPWPAANVGILNGVPTCMRMPPSKNSTEPARSRPARRRGGF